MASPIPEMVPVPAGSVVLRDARTGTSRTVALRAFSMARYPTTWESYAKVLGTGVPDGAHADSPAHSVSWVDAVRWCNAASVVHGLTPAYRMGGNEVAWNADADGYRLPTEAEWEFACRAGSTGPHYGPLDEIAWTETDAVTAAQPVGQKRPNGMGLFDMLGNVWEWCWDYSDPARYADYRVMRGGGWADKHWSVRASVRRGTMPGARFDDLGFRPARGAVAEAGDDTAQGWSRQADLKRARADGLLLPAGWTPLPT